MLNNTKIFTGTANPQLAEAIASILQLPLGKISVNRFQDGEIQVEIHEPVRGQNVFIIQPTCNPVNGTLMELLIMGDAFRRASVKRMIAVIPYFGYSRQDRKPEYTRTPITARLVADMIEHVGFDSVVTVDIHSLQQQGFFNIPTINVSAQPEIVADIYRNNREMSNVVIVSPDIGGTARARAVAKKLGAELAIIDKRRPKANISEVMNIIGNVEGRQACLIDDMADTSSTLCKAANALCDKGVTSVTAYVTHGVFSGNAIQTINESCLKELVITDTIPFTGYSPKIRTLTMSTLLSETIRRIREKESVSEIYV